MVNSGESSMSYTIIRSFADEAHYQSSFEQRQSAHCSLSFEKVDKLPETASSLAIHLSEVKSPCFLFPLRDNGDFCKNVMQ